MSDALAVAREALSRGDLFASYDASTRAIVEGDPSEDLKQQQLLALARMGDGARALTLFRSYGLDRSADPHKRALGARLLKDRALEIKSAPALNEAYQAYRAIFTQSEDPYPGINAATLALLGGDVEEARWLATNILVHPTIEAPADYYCSATRAEALLILGRPADAADAVRLALTLPGHDIGAQAGTLRQLCLLADAAGIDAADRDSLVALLRAPSAFHYAGHMFLAAPAAERRIVADIAAILDARNAGFAYGSAAAGADILVIETILKRGGEAHVIMPCRKEDFIAQSVRPAGEQWVARFEACLQAASAVTYATEMEYVRDPTIFGYAAAIAMGLAKLRAEHLSADVFQLAVWDGKTGGPVGTGADVGLWRERGGETLVVDPGNVARDYPRPEAGGEPPLPRRLASILFTDYAGFSKLTESALPKFDSEVMGRIARVLAGHDDKILARNTWGDALYTVMDGAVAGAEIAVALQRALAAVKPGDLGLAEDQGGMRIAVHFGSVYESTDQITGQPNFQGNEVARAARIEPVTPPGAVYVTEPMAAMIALEAPHRFGCAYVGRVDLAKKYGTFPMYRLTGIDDAALNAGDASDRGAAEGSMLNDTSPTLFVSHHSSKLPVAEHVERALNSKGVKCWVAPRDIEPGDQWDIAIRKAIAESDAMLLLFCSRSEESKQVKRELILADQLGKTIIPLRLERIDPGKLSYHLADSQWIDWLEQRDVVIDRIAAKAHDFQNQSGMEPSPSVVMPASAEDILNGPKVDTAKPAPVPVPTPAPAPAPVSIDKPADTQPSAFGAMPTPKAAAPLPAPDPHGAPPPGGLASFDPGGTGPGASKGRLPLILSLGAIGLLLLVALAALLLQQTGPVDPAPGPGPGPAPNDGRSAQITEGWFAGSWSDYRDCRDAIRFDGGGQFTAPTGVQGTWSIENGDTLVVEDADGQRQSMVIERIGDDEVRGADGTTSYRCN